MVNLQRNFRNDGFAYNFPIVYITANDSLLKVSQFSTKNMPLNLSLILTAIYQKFEKKWALGVSRVGHIFQLAISIPIFSIFLFIQGQQTWYRKLIHSSHHKKQVCFILAYFQFQLKITKSPRFQNYVPHVTLFKNSSYRKPEKYESPIIPYLLGLMSKVFRYILNF